MPDAPRHTSLPRHLHPVAWWIWGVGCAAAASRTLNPVLLVILIGSVCWVVVERRDRRYADPLRVFLLLGLVTVVLRVGMAVLLGNGIHGPTVIVTLPEVPLPDWASAIRVGGPVSLESVMYALYSGLQLAAILACFGAANALASPRRLLRYLPATLYDAGTAVVVALTFAPQLATDARRVRQARALRGHDGGGLREMARLAVPVLEGAFVRSLELAASMESRGYGRSVRATGRSRRLASAMTVVGLLGVVAGLYGLLDGSAGGLLGMPLLTLGAVLAAAALAVGARHETRSAYRREPFGWTETCVAAVGFAVAGILVIGAAREWPGLVPAQMPVAMPELPVWAVTAVVLAALPAVVTPPVPNAGVAR